MRYEMKDNFLRLYDYSPKKTPNLIHNYYDATNLLKRLIKTITRFDGLPSLDRPLWGAQYKVDTAVQCPCFRLSPESNLQRSALLKSRGNYFTD